MAKIKDIETSITYTDDRVGFFSSNEQKWISRIRKLKETHPAEVIILREPEDNDETIYCKVPASWFKLNPPREMSEEAKLVASERMRTLRHKQLNEESRRNE